MAISVDLDDGTTIRVPDLAVDGRNWTKYCKNLLLVAAEETLDRQYDGTDMRPVDATNHELKAWQRRNAIAKQFIPPTIPVLSNIDATSTEDNHFTLHCLRDNDVHECPNLGQADHETGRSR
ncbi:hypothetical protein BU15DRAFT_76165 [Melanogaster broomeanus]|nr:hypothetical protein BU15DRAFT_76165 [Melanogaster broomeanus]